MGIKVALEHRTSYTFDPRALAEDLEPYLRPVDKADAVEATGFTAGRVGISDIREKQARQSTDVGAPGILDLRRMRTVLH
jgi:uncharacterized protein (DUF2126 family)